MRSLFNPDRIALILGVVAALTLVGAANASPIGILGVGSSGFVQATLTTAFAILQEAVLSFLGLGAQPPAPSWGQDINYNQRYITNFIWWSTVGPGLAIFIAVFAFNFLGDALRDWLDPQFRRRA